MPDPRVDQLLSFIAMFRSSTVVDVRDSSVLLDVHIQSVGLEVLGDHHARLDDARRLGQLGLAEGLMRC